MTSFYEDVLIEPRIAFDDLKQLDDKGLQILLDGLWHENREVKQVIMNHLFIYADAYNDKTNHPIILERLGTVASRAEETSIDVRWLALDRIVFHTLRIKGDYDYLTDHIKTVLINPDSSLRLRSTALKAILSCNIYSLEDELLTLFQNATDKVLRARVAMTLYNSEEMSNDFLGALDNSEKLDLYLTCSQNSDKDWKKFSSLFFKNHIEIDEKTGLMLLDVLDEWKKERQSDSNVKNKLQKLSEKVDKESKFYRAYYKRYSPNGVLVTLANLDIHPDDDRMWDMLAKEIYTGKTSFQRVAQILHAQRRKKELDDLYDRTMRDAQSDQIAQRIEQGYQQIQNLIKRMNS